MLKRNEDVKSVVAEVPEGHRHIRTTITFTDGTGITLQEATVANLVRAYVDVKTHPTVARVELSGRRLERRKEGYAEWQLL
jgi:hypothetical protein